MLKLSIASTLTAGTIVLIVIFILASCTSREESVKIDESLLPEGAIVLDVVKTKNNSKYIHYFIYEFRGQCFMQALTSRKGFLTTIACPPGE